jgi:hypothetical protein
MAHGGVKENDMPAPNRTLRKVALMADLECWAAPIGFV